MCFFTLIANTTVLTVIFGQHLAKTSWYLRSFHYVARSCFFRATVYKLQSFGFCHTPKEQQKSIKKCHKCTFQTLLGSMPRLYPCWKDFWPPKNVKTPPELKDLGGGSAAGICNAAGTCRMAWKVHFGTFGECLMFLGCLNNVYKLQCFLSLLHQKNATCWKLRKYQGVFARRCPKTTAKSVAFVTSGKTVNTRLFGFQSAKNFRI